VTRIVTAVLAVACVLALELAIVFVVHRSRLTGVWELQNALVLLLPALALTAIVAGLAGAGLSALALRGHSRAARTGLALSAAVFGGAVGWGVGGGRHLAALPARAGFAAATALALAGLVWVAAPPLARAMAARPRRVAAIALATIAALELANRFVLVRLYPAFHVGLAVATLLAAALLVPTLAAPPGAVGKKHRRDWLAGGALIAIAAAAALLLVPAALRLSRFDNFRLLLLDEAPLFAHAVRAYSELAPPPPLDEAPCIEPAGCGDALEAAAADGPRIDLRGRSVLLVTVDALRADHVGAYGYGRKTTPHIDALANEGALFEHAYCATPHTSYSLTSMMTGKYMRPLLQQGAGHDSDTWASLFRAYGYRTAAFYPPAVFFIDNALFEAFVATDFGFEYRKREFMEGAGRVAQVAEHLRGVDAEQRVFTWVHLFGPHEPYEAQPGHDFGPRDVDRYDSEVAAADATVGELVKLFRGRDPDAVVIVTADHGEEFGDHGGRYHGSTVYEEQVRVPLVISAPRAVGSRRIAGPVQTIDLLPTVLAAIGVPRPPRVRGRDLGPLLAGKAPGPGLALAETEEQVMLAERSDRLLCERKVGACRLFDVAKDPKQQTDIASAEPGRTRELRSRLRELSASHGRFEVRGLRAEGKGWPAAILRGVTGDGDAAEEIATLLDDADLAIRRKAAELLFRLRRPETAPALRLALSRDEDSIVKSWAALALTRLDEGAPLAYELAKSDDPEWRRLAALALAESGDRRGEATLIEWWKDGGARDYERARELLAAFAEIRSKDAVWPLVQSLDDVRLRPHVAATLAAIGDEAGRVALVKALGTERYQSARVAIARAAVELGAEAELAPALVRFLGVPDPLPDGVGLAMRAGILQHIGGPTPAASKKLGTQSHLGAALTLVVPKGGNGRGVRALVRARSPSAVGQVHLGARLDQLKYDAKGQPKKVRDLPRIDPKRSVRIPIPVSPELVEVHAVLPRELDARPGRPIQLVVYADRDVELAGLALVPLADELPPPPPEPWQKAPAPAP
jgi:arylsulfatase A-like enzyme/HEAT repeat protein